MHLPSVRALPRPAFSRLAALLLAGLAATQCTGRAADTVAEPPAFLRQIETHFAGWDRDHDDILSSLELDQAIATPSVRGEEAAALVALRRASRSRKLDLPPLTRPAIAGLLETRLRDEDDDRDQADTLGQYYTLALKRIATAKRELFVSGQPQLDTFRQGRLGSCFSLAPLAAILHRDPAEVAKLFRANPDGTYTVTFNGGAAPVTVTTPTDAELALSSTSGDDGIWPAVYEKAVGQLRAKPAAGKPAPPPLSVVTKGGSAGTMLSTLTGHPIKRFSCSPWRARPAVPESELAAKLDDLRAMLRETFSAGRLATVGTPAKGTKVPSLALGHAYAVLAYDAATDRVTIRDPHGQTFTPKGAAGLENGYPVEHGIWSAPLPEVVRFMAGFAFEQPSGAPLNNYATASAATAADAAD